MLTIFRPALPRSGEDASG
jgi:hypothetical protein